MRFRSCLIAAVIVLPCAGTAALAQDVPLPRPRPATVHERLSAAPPLLPSAAPTLSLAPAPELQQLTYPEATAGPSACELRLGELAQFTPLPVLMGPGECGAADVVRLEAVRMPDRTQVALNPPATLRCRMAEAVAIWVRQDVGPAAADLGSPLKQIANYDSYDCRGRNRVVGAKMSEHGRANALDIRALRLGNGVNVELTDLKVAKAFRDRMRIAACGRFTTVLGPGSDGYHESHIHLDLAERSRGYRMCQWDVREPKPLAEPEAGAVADVPLPQPKPAALTANKPPS